MRDDDGLPTDEADHRGALALVANDVGQPALRVRADGATVGARISHARAPAWRLAVLRTHVAGERLSRSAARRRRVRAAAVGRAGDACSLVHYASR